MRDRRLVYVVLAAVALVVLFVVFRPRNEDEGSAATLRTTTSTPTAEPAPTGAETETETAQTTTAPTAMRWRVDARDEKLDRLTVPRGMRVRLVVVADVTDEVHVHGYDLTADVAPGAPGVVEFTADTPGRFEIELENRGREIAQLTVEP